MLRIDREALMWKITTRGFTLEEVLMAAMNLLARADTAKYERRASQTSSRRYQAVPFGRAVTGQQRRYNVLDFNGTDNAFLIQ